jgi:hypothetical protein
MLPPLPEASEVKCSPDFMPIAKGCLAFAPLIAPLEELSIGIMQRRLA